VGLSHFPNWCVLVWAAGAATFAAFLAFTHHQLRKRIVARRPLTDSAVLELLEDCKQQMGIRAPVLLVETGDVGSPSLFGFVRPRLLLPSGLTKSFSREELRYMLLHELAHIKRRDILVGWCMAALQVVHWFNPLVWLAFRRMRADRELACDALTLSCFGAGHAQAYGRTIIKLLERFGRSAWAPCLAGAVESKQQLNERITMIAEFNAKKRSTKLALLLCTLLGAVAMTDAQPPATPPTRKDLVGTWLLVGENGAVSNPSGRLSRLKFITETHWTITQADKKTRVVIFHGGGTYTLDGNRYVEKVEFANEINSEGLGKKAIFEIKLDGDILHLHGIEGTPWQEDWKRIKVTDLQDEKDAATPASSKS
jgi:beta-lactamase regulating signal transducer with metallopeptidase domain